jgi:hypothetical protein
MQQRLFNAGFGAVALALACAPAHAIKRADMPAFCEGKVVATYAVPAGRIRMREVMKSTDGSYSIDGTVRKGRRTVERFRCEFDAKGAFVGLLEIPRPSQAEGGRRRGSSRL